jgi:hypothetical protein
MVAEHLPFELISLPPADPTAHRAAEQRNLLAQRRLPDAFRRRCIFHRIELTPVLVEAAVESMARATSSDSGGANVGASFPHLDRATRDVARKRFCEIRELPGLEKKPSTAELLTWLCILSTRRVDPDILERSGLKDLPGKEALIKDYEELQRLG